MGFYSTASALYRNALIDYQQSLIPNPKIDLKTDWAQQWYESNAQFKFAKGGRYGGKSHNLAEVALKILIEEPEESFLCARLNRRDLSRSAVRLFRNKILDLGLEGNFEIKGGDANPVIYNTKGRGQIDFTGLQEHSAVTIKSYEDYKYCWLIEANEISQKAIDVAIPTFLRKAGSQIWADWNPDQPTDPIELELKNRNPDPRKSLHFHLTYLDNPLLAEEVVERILEVKEKDPEKYEWLYAGKYNYKSNLIVFAGRWGIEDIDAHELYANWEGPFYGADWGSGPDPTVLTKLWYLQTPEGDKNRIHIEKQSYEYKLGIELIPQRWMATIPEAKNAIIRGDSSGTVYIDYVRRNGFPHLLPVKKPSDSVETGTEWLRDHYITVASHLELQHIEFRRHRYKEYLGEAISKIVDRDNHGIDSARYGLVDKIYYLGGTSISTGSYSSGSGLRY